jgi:hypothetical protein
MRFLELSGQDHDDRHPKRQRHERPSRRQHATKRLHNDGGLGGFILCKPSYSPAARARGRPEHDFIKKKPPVAGPAVFL